jgi:hypothetical protein
MPLRDYRRQLLPELLAFESGIDPRQHDFYRRNYQEPAIRSIVVEQPGRCRRDLKTGAVIVEEMTVGEYFESLGVADMFDKDCPECLIPMQYRSINGLGFFGFQFGEPALMSLGVYEPPRVPIRENGETIVVSRHYVGEIPPSFWRYGRRQALYQQSGEVAAIFATDVNTWKGKFTGRYRASSYDHCVLPATQKRLIRTLMRANLRMILGRLARSNASLPECLGRRGVDLSGALAAAHLCGGRAVAQYLLDGVIVEDELGTSIEEYLSRFADLEVPVSEAAAAEKH